MVYLGGRLAPRLVPGRILWSYGEILVVIGTRMSVACVSGRKSMKSAMSKWDQAIG